MSVKSTPTRFGSVAISLHWLTALLVIVLLVTGIRSGSTEDPASKAALLTIHLPVAIVVLLLTLARLIWWLRVDTKPTRIDSIAPWQDSLAHWMHRLLYLLLIVMLGSGIAMSMMTGLPMALFGDAPMPEFSGMPPRAVHGLGSTLLMATVLLHALAALYHHYVAKDATLRRMWFGNS